MTESDRIVNVELTIIAIVGGGGWSLVYSGGLTTFAVTSLLLRLPIIMVYLPVVVLKAFKLSLMFHVPSSIPKKLNFVVVDDGPFEYHLLLNLSCGTLRL